METFRGLVYPAQCDAMGHLNIQAYVGFFDQAEVHCFLHLGYSAEYLHTQRIGWATVRHVIEYKTELIAGDFVVCTSTVTRVGTKSLTTDHRLINASTGVVCATCEATTAQYDLAARRAVLLIEPVRRAAIAAVGDGGSVAT